MPNTVYNKIIEIMVTGSVPIATAQQSLDRLITLNGLDANSIDYSFVSEYRLNIVGVVMLRGDKSTLEIIKTALDAITN